MTKQTTIVVIGNLRERDTLSGEATLSQLVTLEKNSLQEQIPFRVDLFSDL